MDKRILIIFLQIVIIFAFITIITIFIRIDNALKLEKRISRYSVRNGDKNKTLSIFDKIWRKYLHFVKNQRKQIGKLFPRLTVYYNKYSVGSEQRAEDFLTHKIVISFVFLLFSLITLIIKGKFMSLFQIITSVLIGFFALDIYLILMRIINKKKIENDMLRAIIVMNNAFKSGKTTIQAVEIASKKLPKPIGYEFQKIYDEMKYGLSIDTVFDRFAKRVNIEEAEYLASSLIILNRTGGNIVAVFESIEKTLFSKMKLNEELKSATSLSKLVVIILICIPFIIIGAIYSLDPEYFNPFFASPLGYLMFSLIILMLIVYMILLYKIAKVDY